MQNKDSCMAIRLQLQALQPGRMAAIGPPMTVG